MKWITYLSLLFFSISAYSFNNEVEIKKTYLEDIFIWKMSDELKLTVNEEKQFTEINKSLNKKKAEINKKIQHSIQSLNEDDSERALANYKKLIHEYNQLSINEFESIKKLLGRRKFINYLKIKSELTTKVKSFLIGEKSADRDEKKLPPPKVIIETK